MCVSVVLLKLAYVVAKSNGRGVAKLCCRARPADKALGGERWRVSQGLRKGTSERAWAVWWGIGRGCDARPRGGERTC